MKNDRLSGKVGDPVKSPFLNVLLFLTSTWNCLSRCRQLHLTAVPRAKCALCFRDNTDDARRREWIYRHLTIGMTDIRETSVSAVIIKDLLNHRSADLWHKPSLLHRPTDAPAGGAGKRCFARLCLPPPPLPHWNEIPHPISAIGQVWKAGDLWSDIAVIPPPPMTVEREGPQIWRIYPHHPLADIQRCL